MMLKPHADDLDEILNRAEPWLRRLAGERLFITGGTGFFGRWLLEALTWADDRLDLRLRITVLSRDPEAFAHRASALATHRALDWWRGDVRDFTPPPGRFPFVIHAATAASEQLNRTQPLLMFDTIISGTRHVLEFADRAGCAAMLLTSSGAVYGPQPSEHRATGRKPPRCPRSKFANVGLRRRQTRGRVPMCGLRPASEDRARLRLRWPLPALRRAFCRGQFHARPVARQAHRHPRRRHALPLLSIRGRSGGMAARGAARRPAESSLQRRVRRGSEHCRSRPCGRACRR